MSQVEAATLGSEKSKDIRQTNIIAAKGKDQDSNMIMSSTSNTFSPLIILQPSLMSSGLLSAPVAWTKW